MFLLKITQIIQITWMIEIIPNIDVTQKIHQKPILLELIEKTELQTRIELDEFLRSK